MFEMLLMCLADKKMIEKKENNKKDTRINDFIFNQRYLKWLQELVYM